MVKMRVLLCVLLLPTLLAVPATTITNVQPSNCSSGSETSMDSALQRVYRDQVNIVLLLEAGEHCISMFNNTLEGLHNVTIEGEVDTTVRCLPGKGLAVFNATDFTIRNVVFDQCGISNSGIYDFLAMVNRSIDFFFSISMNSMNNISLLCGHCVDFQMTRVTVKNTLGLGFLGINLIGESVLDNVTFSNNVPTGCYFLSSDVLNTERIGGGALLIYADYIEDDYYNLTNTYRLSVSDSYFLCNSYCSKLYLTQFYTDYVNNDLDGEEFVYLLNGGGGLSLKLAQLGYKVDFTVINSVFRNNTARGGGGANIQVYAGVYNSSIDVINCSFCQNGLEGDIVEFYDYLTFGSGLLVATDSYNPRIYKASCLNRQYIAPTAVNIVGTNFTGNRAFSAAAVSVVSLYSPGQRRQFPHIVMFTACEFKQNYAFSGSALLIQEWKYIAAQPGLNVVLENVKVVENVNFKIQQVSSELIPSGIIHVLATNITLSGESIIKSNVGSGLYLERAILHISGHVTVVNNSASLGAGIRVESQSLIIVSNNSKLNLIDNRASVYGGGIYSNIVPESGRLQTPDCPIYFGELNLLCFQDFTEKCANLSDFNLTVAFSGNNAQFGSMIYGATLATCPWAIQLNKSDNESIFELLYINQQTGLHTPMHFDIAPNTSKAVATAPITLKIINASNEPIDTIPGHSVTVQAIALDEFEFPAVTVLTSVINEQGQIDQDKRSQVGLTNYWLLDSDTINISMKVFANNELSTADFNVTLVTVGSYAQDNVLIHLIGCPPGFEFDRFTNSCKCDDRLYYVPTSPVLCNMDDSLSVPQGVWIGYMEGENDTLVTSPCHFDYCKENDKNVSKGNFSSQCNDDYNRAGVGCGECKEGYGLMLGSNRCSKCSNLSLLLIIAFAFIGIVLILLMSLLRITVTNGYLNGILFYSAIITLFSSVLSAQSRAVSSLLQFFSWLNLDLAFELCFYTNMTASQRAILRFAFPVYLYALMLTIIVVAKISQRFASVFNRGGYSATKLFATLFVLTYANILRNCIEILGSSYVTGLDGNQSLVWTVDPNQHYFSGEHIPLFILAIFVLVLYLIPAPLILLFPSVTLRIPVLKRYKPLYDAFWNPFKPKFQFWIGMRLFLRFFPMFLNYSVQSPLNILLLVVFLLVLVYAQAILQPFNGKGRNASDLFLLINLIGLLSGFLFFFVFEFNSRDIPDSVLEELLQGKIVYFSICIGLVYFQLLIFLIVKIFVRFPILQYIGWKLITTVCRCKIFAKWIPKKPKISYGPIIKKKSYGTTAEIESEVTTDVTSASSEVSEESDEGIRRSSRPTYSELREPLMDIGEAEIIARKLI